MKLLYSFLFASLLLINTGNCLADENTDKYNDIILKGSVDTVGHVLINLEDQYKREGKEALKPFVPAIADRFMEIAESAEETRTASEAEAGTAGQMIALLLYSSDIRAKDALLKAMESNIMGGTRIKQGLMNLGPQVIPDIIKSIDNSKYASGKGKAIDTLYYIYENDTTKTFFSEKDKKEISEKIVPHLSQDNELIKLSAVRALGVFGDDSVIPLLERIKEEYGPLNDVEDQPFERKTMSKETEKAIKSIKEKKD